MAERRAFTQEKYQQALESWSFVDLNAKTPLLASLLGDVFFESPNGCWFLDVITGELESPWRTREDLERALEAPARGRDYLREGLVAEASAVGIRPASNQILDFTTPPVLGGPQTAQNLRPMDFVVAINLLGQIHTQVRDLPPGTRIDGIQIE